MALLKWLIIFLCGSYVLSALDSDRTGHYFVDSARALISPIFFSQEAQNDVTLEQFCESLNNLYALFRNKSCTIGNRYIKPRSHACFHNPFHCYYEWKFIWISEGTLRKMQCSTTFILNGEMEEYSSNQLGVKSDYFKHVESMQIIDEMRTVDFSSHAYKRMQGMRLLALLGAFVAGQGIASFYGTPLRHPFIS